MVCCFFFSFSSMSKFVWPAECFTVHSGSEKYSLAKPVRVGFETESYSVHGHVQVKWQFKIRWTCWCESGWTNVKGMLSLSRGFVVPWKTNSFVILLQIPKWMKKCFSGKLCRVWFFEGRHLVSCTPSSVSWYFGLGILVLYWRSDLEY